MDETLHSQHPVDVLIRELVAGHSTARASDVDQIIERIATAPFHSRQISVPQEWRGGDYLGISLGSVEMSLTLHLIKRIAIELQWNTNTTADMYANDLRQVVRIDSSRLGVYRRRGGTMAISVGTTFQVVPFERRGTRSLPLLVVVYSVDQGMIVSGYQASEWETISIPGDTLWLR